MKVGKFYTEDTICTKARGHGAITAELKKSAENKEEKHVRRGLARPREQGRDQTMEILTGQVKVLGAYNRKL